MQSGYIRAYTITIVCSLFGVHKTPSEQCLKTLNKSSCPYGTNRITKLIKLSIGYIGTTEENSFPFDLDLTYDSWVIRVDSSTSCQSRNRINAFRHSNS